MPAPHAADVAAVVRRARRAVAVRRRLLAGLCAAGAVALSLDALAPPRPHLDVVLTAARDLPAGSTLATADLALVEVPSGLVPDGALRPGAEVVGRALAGPVRRGETLTDARLVGPSLLDAVTGAGDVVAVPVRLGDRDAAGLVRAGDRVDVLAAPLDAGDGTTPSVEVVASAALVLAVPQVTDSGEGSLLVVAVPPGTARDLARAATTSRLSLALRRAP